MTTTITDEALEQIRQMQGENARLREALDFYANPETYHAIMIAGDAPCGEFDCDFCEDEWTKECGYNRPMPGMRARAALSRTGEP